MTPAIHRLFERRAADNGDAIAITHDSRSVSYRELNAAANTLARRLLSAGFRHGMQARICMAPSVDLAVVLLAVLKAGGCYLWSQGEPTTEPADVSIRIGGVSPSDEERDLHLGDIPSDARIGPNLPVITRDTDIACLLERDGETPIAVPHATVISLTAYRVADRSRWAGEPGALDLWIALMSGATAVVSEEESAAA